MRQSYPFRIDENDKVYAKLKKMSRRAKDLYNQALWVVKEHYKNTGHILSYCDLDKIMKKKENLEGSINYGLLPAKVSQQVLMLLVKGPVSLCSTSLSFIGFKFLLRSLCSSWDDFIFLSL